MATVKVRLERLEKAHNEAMLAAMKRLLDFVEDPSDRLSFLVVGCGSNPPDPDVWTPPPDAEARAEAVWSQLVAAATPAERKLLNMPEPDGDGR